MKIVVFPNNTGDFFIKPDSSLITDSRDFFAPDFFKGISAGIAIIIKISKSAKCVSREQSERYYKEISTGINFYPENLLNCNVGYFSISKVINADNTAYINDSFIPKEEISKIGQLAFFVDGDAKFIYTAEKVLLNEIDKAIEEITIYSSLKCGDLILLEISERIPVSTGNNIKLSYSDATCLDFCIR